MKLLKSPYALLVLSMVFFSIEAYSIAEVIRPNLHSGMQNSERFGAQLSNGGASRLGEVNCMLKPESYLHKAGWYQDRDNSMSPVSTRSGVGAAMAILMTLIGYSQGIQVCPGVYLATAHGVVDNPIKSIEDGGALRSPSNNAVRVVGYPMDPDNMMVAEGSDSQYVSPRLRDPSDTFTWSDPTTDYVFVRVDNPPIRPNDFVTPVRSSNQRLIEASTNGEIDVYLYRPQTKFNTDSNGTPDFNDTTWATDIEKMVSLYQAPMRVNEPCQTVQGYEGLVALDCPNEQAVSGSPEITNINGQDYIVGMHIQGRAASEDSFERTPLPNAYIPSSHFCEDYEKVCGKPCAELDEVLTSK